MREALEAQTDVNENLVMATAVNGHWVRGIEKREFDGTCSSGMGRGSESFATVPGVEHCCEEWSTQAP